MADMTKHFTPLNRVVSSAVIDTNTQLSDVQEKFFHWAVRGLRKQQNENLNIGKRYVTLPVNPNTNTATLPPDFDTETFVGIIDRNGEKIALSTNSSIAPPVGIEEIVENACAACGQSKNICEEIKVTEDSYLVELADGVYEQTVIRKVLPNGDLYLETITPILNIETGDVIFVENKEYVSSLNKLPCGCLKPSEENKSLLRTYCSDVYYKYYAKHGYPVGFGGYKIFEESGFIAFDEGFKFDKVYLEYKGFLPKINGQYQVPSMAFEMLVEWVKFKYAESKKSSDKAFYWERYRIERSNFTMASRKMSLHDLNNLLNMIPKFSYNVPHVCGCSSSARTVQAAPIELAEQGPTAYSQSTKTKMPFSLQKKGGCSKRCSY